MSKTRVAYYYKEDVGRACTFSCGAPAARPALLTFALHPSPFPINSVLLWLASWRTMQTTTTALATP